MSEKKLYGRTLARAQAFQILFQAEAAGRSVSEVLADTYNVTDGPLSDYAFKLASGAGSMQDDIDLVVSSVSTNWSVDRINNVDRNLLRIAIYEILEVDSVDTAVSINEIVELAKVFGTDDSPRFVNGILGKITRLMDEGVDVIEHAKADGEDA